MDDDMELQTAREEVHKGIGRNLLLFQRAELSLKHLNALGKLTGNPADLMELFAGQKAVFHKQTMGQQINHFHDNHCIGKDLLDEPSGEETGTIISHSFSFMESGSDGGARKLALEKMVDERNHLVHQMFAGYDSDSLEQCRDMVVKLDAQRERILPEFRRIARNVESVQEGFKCIAEYLASPEGRAELRLPCLQKSPVILALIELAAPNAQPDGWTPLHVVGKLIQQQFPGCISARIAESESKSFSGLVLASQLFDLKQETTDTGGTRAFYRVKVP